MDPYSLSSELGRVCSLSNSEAKCQFSAINRDVLMNAQSSHSGGPLLSLLCSARVRHCHRLLVDMVNWIKKFEKLSRLVIKAGQNILFSNTYFT